MATLLDITDAVVASLNGGSFSQPFTADRDYAPVYDLASLRTLRVTVIPQALAVEPASRGKDFFDVRVEVGVQNRVRAGVKADMDVMAGLVHEMVDHLRNNALDDAPAAMLTSIENDPVYSPEHLKEFSVFTSIVAVMYRLDRA